MYKTLYFTLIAVLTHVHAIDWVYYDAEENLHLKACPFIPKNQVVQQSVECCNNLTKAFENTWYKGQGFLTRYLQTLKSWKCTKRLKEECQQKTFVFTDFTENVYLLFCNHTQFEAKCSSNIKSTLKSDYHTLSWNDTISKIDVSSLSKTNLLDPCLQAVMYEIDKDESFVEFVKVDYQLCAVIWGGFQSESLKIDNFELWDIYPSGCQTLILLTSGFFVLLNIFGFLLNMSVLAVISTTKSLRHSQWCYKASIATSDVMLALFVFPSMINNLMKQNYLSLISSEVFVNSSANFVYSIPNEPEIFQQAYLDVFGILSMLVILVSIYTLVLAAADRLYAVTYPLKYRKSNTKLLSFRLCLLVWVMAFIICLAPCFSGPNLYYSVNHRALITSRGESSGILIAIILGLPLLVIWVITLLTFYKTYRHTQKSTNLKGKLQKSSSQSSVEIRLAKTLLLMVGTFTLSVLPAVIMYAIDASVKSINLSDPKKIDMNLFRRYLIAEYISFVSLMFNTMWNFFIYNARNRAFKKAFRKMIAKILLQIGCVSLYNRLQASINNIKSSRKSEEKHQSQKASAGHTLSPTMLQKSEPLVSDDVNEVRK